MRVRANRLWCDAKRANSRRSTAASSTGRDVAGWPANVTAYEKRKTARLIAKRNAPTHAPGPVAPGTLTPRYYRVATTT
jgi:hypothetical protein